MRSILDHLVCLVLDTASDEFTRGVGGELSGEEDEAIGFDGLRLLMRSVSVVSWEELSGAGKVIRSKDR